MEKKRIAPDGSCLFNAIHYASCGLEEADAATNLRSLVAQRIREDAGMYSEVYLGKDPEEYVAWIQTPHNYGGEVEILILAQYYQVNVAVVSIDQTITQLIYSPTQITTLNPIQTIFILYNGQHYDALVLSSSQQHSFSDQELEELDLKTKALDLATSLKAQRDRELRTRHRKKIKCSCGVICLDTSDFQIHATEVDHGDDWGYDCEEVVVEEIVENPNDE